MKKLNEAYKTIDGTIFEDKEEATLHENLLLAEKELSKLINKWGNYYWSSEQIKDITRKVFDDKDKLLEILGA